MSANSDHPFGAMHPSHERGRQVLVEAARQAPSAPGVYFFLAADGELLYTGKAADLRRRLNNHARSAAIDRESRSRWVAPSVHDVRWITCTDEREALCREADVVVALSPRFNASMAEDAFTFVCVAPITAGDRLSFRLSETTGGGRVYGAFPHLGKGKGSWVAKRCNAGYSALLRLLWVACGNEARRFRVPSKLRGSSPSLDTSITVDRAAHRALHDYLSGRGRRLIDALSHVTSDAPAFMQRPLAADLEGAEEFYRLGPHTVRALRRRHGLPAAPLDQPTFTRVVADDLRDAIGDFQTPSRSTQAALVGARMSRSMHLRRESARRV